jgi:hypothetical protein
MRFKGNILITGKHEDTQLLAVVIKKGLMTFSQPCGIGFVDPETKSFKFPSEHMSRSHGIAVGDIIIFTAQTANDFFDANGAMNNQFDLAHCFDCIQAPVPKPTPKPYFPKAKPSKAAKKS